MAETLQLSGGGNCWTACTPCRYYLQATFLKKQKKQTSSILFLLEKKQKKSLLFLCFLELPFVSGSKFAVAAV